MKTKLYVLSMAAALSCGLPALFAQDAPPPPPAGTEGRPGEGRPPGQPQGGGDRLAEFIKKADTNGDGKISKEEFAETTKKEADDRFSKIDTNGDGYVEKGEAEEMAKRAREMQRPDGAGMRRPDGGGDRDGGTRPRPGTENQPGGPGTPGGDTGFRRPDGPRPDGPRPDGPRPEGFRRPDGEPGSPGAGQGGRPSFGAGMISERLKRMDKNGDQTISKEEYVAGSEEQFAQMDENKDGKITMEELEALGRRMREMMGGGNRGGDGARRPDGAARPDGERPRRPDGEAPPAPPAPPASEPKKEGA